MKKLIITIASILITHSMLAQHMAEKTSRYYGKPIIEMQLNGQSVWVLLDTGSDVNVLDLNAQKKYGFKTYRSMDKEIEVVGFGSAQNILLQTENVQLNFDEVKMKGKFYSYDLTTVKKSIRARTGKNISAIIGTKMMRYHGFVIDLGNNTVSMTYKIKKKDMKRPDYGTEFTIAKSSN